MHAVVVERRDVAVLLWAEALQPGLSRMYPQRIGAGRKHRVGQCIERHLGATGARGKPREVGERNGVGTVQPLPDSFGAALIPETLRRTNLGDSAPGTPARINLISEPP